MRCAMLGDGFRTKDPRGAFPKLIDRLLDRSQWTTAHFG